MPNKWKQMEIQAQREGGKKKEYVQGIKAVDQGLENLHSTKTYWESQDENSSQKKKYHQQQKSAIIQSPEMLTSFCSRNIATTKELSPWSSWN